MLIKKFSVNRTVLNKFYYFPGFILFFLMLFVPTTYQSFKAALLVIVLIQITVTFLYKNKLNLHYKVFLWTLIMVTTGLFFMFLGLINNTPGALRVSTVYVLWPMVYTILVAGATNKKTIEGLLKVLVYATIVIGIYSLSYILYKAGWLPEFLYIEIEQGQIVVFYNGYIEYRMFSISSLVFLVPFLMAALLTWPKDFKLIKRYWIWIAFVLGIILVMLSGRRALLLVVALAPVIAIILRQFTPFGLRVKNRKIIISALTGGTLLFIVLVIYLQKIYGFSISALYDTFKTGFDFKGDINAMTRSEQFFALIDGWLGNPIFGSGHGGALKDLQRSEQFPWAYELSYVALLFHTGIVGFTIYFCGILWIVINGIKMIRIGDTIGQYMLPILVGTICFLIANATNPYLGKYDYIWVVFFPVLLINFWLLNKKVAKDECAK